jgi:hypothetical protein
MLHEMRSVEVSTSLALADWEFSLISKFGRFLTVEQMAVVWRGRPSPCQFLLHKMVLQSQDQNAVRISTTYS